MACYASHADNVSPHSLGHVNRTFLVRTGINGGPLAARSTLCRRCCVETKCRTTIPSCSSLNRNGGVADRARRRKHCYASFTDRNIRTTEGSSNGELDTCYRHVALLLGTRVRAHVFNQPCLYCFAPNELRTRFPGPQRSKPERLKNQIVAKAPRECTPETELDVEWVHGRRWTKIKTLLFFNVCRCIGCACLRGVGVFRLFQQEHRAKTTKITSMTSRHTPSSVRAVHHANRKTQFRVRGRDCGHTRILRKT